MRQLESEDVYWIGKRLPKSVWEVLKANQNKMFVAGGFLRACIAREEVNDIDLFSPDKTLAERSARAIVNNGSRLKLFETPNAYTILGDIHPIQFIHRWPFDDPAKCVESFDFTIARAAVWVGNEKDKDNHAALSSVCDDQFYPDLAAKRLRYCAPVRNEEAGGSLLRVLKFYQKGYRIPLDSLGAVMARLACAVDPTAVANAVEAGAGDSVEARTAFVLTGLLREVDPNLGPSEHNAKYVCSSPG